MSNTVDAEQVAAAEAYEGLHVPALFGQWAPRVLDALSIRTGDDLLDVACGTGVLAREAVAAVGPTGSVAGVDPGPGMLAVAARLEPAVDWRQGTAEALPFDVRDMRTIALPKRDGGGIDVLDATRCVEEVTKLLPLMLAEDYQPASIVSLAERKAAFETLRGSVETNDSAEALLLAELARQVGNWKTTVRNREGPDGEWQTMTGTATYEPIFGGRFVIGRDKGVFEMEGQKMEHESMMILGFDNLQQEWTSRYYSSMSTWSGELRGKKNAKGEIEYEGLHVDNVTPKGRLAKAVSRWEGDDKMVFEMWDSIGGEMVHTLTWTAERVN